MAVAGAFFLLLDKLGAERAAAGRRAPATVVVGLWGLFQWLGTVFVSPDGLDACGGSASGAIPWDARSRRFEVVVARAGVGVGLAAVRGGRR